MKNISDKEVFQNTIEKICAEWSVNNLDLKSAICVKECESAGCHGGCEPDPDM